MDDTHRLTRKKTADTDHLSPTAPLPESSAKTKKGDRNECSSRVRETKIVLPIHSCIGGERK